MIFPTEALRALRDRLGAQVKAGTMSDSEAYREALAADPDDFTSITCLFDEALTARRLAEAERLGWELLRTAPASPHSYLLLTTVLEKRRRQSNLPMQFLMLGLEMLLYDAESLEEFDLAQLLDDQMLGLVAGLAKPEALRVVLNGLRQMDGHRGALPCDEVAPYRHILALRAAGSRAMERDVVEAVLADPARSAPLLRGILKQYAEGDLDGETLLVERAIGLLGEVGDPETIRDLTGFFVDDYLVNPAMWAGWRIAGRHPDEALAVVRRWLPGAEPLERFAAAQLLVQMPRTAGLVEALAEVLEDIEHLARDQRSGILSAVLCGIYIVDGADSQTGARLEQRYARLLTKRVRKQVGDIREVRRKTGPQDPHFETTIYDICCAGPDYTREDSF
jgi:hypothetical protein